MLFRSIRRLRIIGGPEVAAALVRMLREDPSEAVQLSAAGKLEEPRADLVFSQTGAWRPRLAGDIC